MSTTAIKYDASFASKSNKTAPRRAGHAWTDVEQMRLREAFTRGQSLEHIATSLERSGSAVLARLVEMRLLIRRDLGNYRYAYHVNDGFFIQHNFFNPYAAQAVDPTSNPTPPWPCANPNPVSRPAKTATKEAPMTTIVFSVDTLTTINGKNAADFSDDDIFKMIADTENAVAKLDAIKHKPAKLKKKIEDLNDVIAKLVAYVDAR